MLYILLLFGTEHKTITTNAHLFVFPR